LSTDARRPGRATPRAVATAAPRSSPPKAGRRARRAGGATRPRKRGLGPLAKVGIVVGLAILVLAGVFYVVNTSPVGSGGSSQYPYVVGQPGPGAKAPPVRLTATDGSTFDLAAQRGHMVLLYFQEGVGCQPCWDQITDIQTKRDQFQALGVGQIVTITSSPMDALKQKAADEAITIPVLADPNLAVSRAYQANQYGMMGTSMDGHSFILVDKDGVIKWRADYGGAPKYTMYVPAPTLLNDLQQGLKSPTR